MDNAFDTMRQALSEADTTISAGDEMARRIAVFLVGRLRNVARQTVLSALKKELKNFNSHTGEWK